MAYLQLEAMGIEHVAVETAVALGWIEDSTEFVPDAPIQRGELVSLFNSVLGLYR